MSVKSSLLSEAGRGLSVCHISLGLCVLTHKLIPNAAKKMGKKQLTQEVDLISFSSSYSCSSVSKIVEVNSSSSFSLFLSLALSSCAFRFDSRQTACCLFALSICQFINLSHLQLEVLFEC